MYIYQYQYQLWHFSSKLLSLSALRVRGQLAQWSFVLYLHVTYTLTMYNV